MSRTERSFSHTMKNVMSAVMKARQSTQSVTHSEHITAVSSVLSVKKVEKSKSKRTRNNGSICYDWKNIPETVKIHFIS